MRRTFVLLASFSLLVLTGFSQKIHTRIGLDGQLDFRLANLPLRVIDPDGNGFNIVSGSSMSLAAGTPTSPRSTRSIVRAG